MRLPGLSYGSSIAQPHREHLHRAFKSEWARVVLDLVHPSNLGELPPSPTRIAYKGELMGVAKFSEFWKEIWR